MVGFTTVQLIASYRAMFYCQDTYYYLLPVLCVTSLVIELMVSDGVEPVAVGGILPAVTTVVAVDGV